MTVSPSTLTVALVAAGLCVACGDAPSAASQSPAAATSGQAAAPPGEVVAEVAGRKITLAELDQKWQEVDAGEKARVTQMLYQNRRNVLDQVIGDALIEQAAKASGAAVDTFVAEDAARRAQPVSEADIKQFFDQNADRTQGRTLDQLRPAIKSFLESQRKLQARAQLIEELKGKTGGVRVLLEPPRQSVDFAATDPARGESTAPITIVEFSDYQ